MLRQGRLGMGGKHGAGSVCPSWDGWGVDRWAEHPHGTETRSRRGIVAFPDGVL